jgi:hypothetical protein
LSISGFPIWNDFEKLSHLLYTAGNWRSGLAAFFPFVRALPPAAGARQKPLPDRML